MRVEVKVRIYELDGKDTCVEKVAPELLVISHWNSSKMVNLQYGEHTYTVLVSELRRALDAAEKAHPW